MTRTCLASRTLATLLLVLAPVAGLAQEKRYELQCSSADGFIQVTSDHAVDPARCKVIVARVQKAFAFVSQQAAWSNSAILSAKPLQFRLLGGSLNLLGYAQGQNLMVMKDDYMDKPLSEGTLAHELTHIQDARQLKGKRIPSYLAEGRALTIGNAYRVHLGQPPGDYDRQMAGSAIRFTSAQAMELMDQYRNQGWDNQAIGTVLVEYMRTKWRGSGVPDINPRLSRMIERIGGGDELEAAFQSEFGESATAFTEDFARYLDATQSDPKQRLKGTMWQAVDPGETTKASRSPYVIDEIDLLEALLY